MKRIMIAVLSIAVLAAAAYLAIPKDHALPVADLPAQQNEKPAGDPSFTWRYLPLSEEEGIPYSRISIVVEYPDGSSQTRDLDTIAGSCNEYSEPDADVYERSTMVICYYAGLGHYYKVVRVEDEFQVWRRVFEEASPEYDPPIQGYEIIARF